MILETENFVQEKEWSNILIVRKYDPLSAFLLATAGAFALQFHTNPSADMTTFPGAFRSAFGGMRSHVLHHTSHIAAVFHPSLIGHSAPLCRLSGCIRLLQEYTLLDTSA